MKFAIFSDIHSNVYALEASLNHAKDQGCDRFINLGDILYGPIAPRETYNLLMRENFITICGNQDRQIFEATSDEIDTNPTMQFILDDLGQEPLDWMRSLPFDTQLTEEIYLCHGSPTNDLIYLLENVSSGSPTVRSDDEILKLLDGQSSDIILCGHTHIPRAITLSTGQQIINPGSVGLPAYQDDLPVLHAMENYSPHASYAILEQMQGQWITSHMKVPYDTSSAAKCAELRGRHDWAHYLRTGRKLPDA